jgi:hypothetical protein
MKNACQMHHPFGFALSVASLEDELYTECLTTNLPYTRKVIWEVILSKKLLHNIDHILFVAVGDFTVLTGKNE